MFLDTQTRIYRTNNVGAVETSFFRPFFGFKQYLDTADLGTALTYSNPYILGRFEYWYQKNKFIDRDDVPNQTGGGIGTGLGLGFEFPIELKKSYIGVEYLYHVVNFFDKFTQDYQKDPTNPTGSKYGYTNLAGNVHSVMITYNFTW
jgi:hypothetical protein